ncbi:MAG: hypothetical protein H6739_42290, partial [Alphaproteobacteria bacterium]|nr:hypothetical protein [Alphaproteobacteria bacterium]
MAVSLSLLVSAGLMSGVARAEPPPAELLRPGDLIFLNAPFKQAEAFQIATGAPYA